MPPWRAIAIAIRDSVTVSIAAEISGTRERDLAGQPRGGVDLARDDVGLAGQQQHVVVGQAQLGERGCRCRLGSGRGNRRGGLTGRQAGSGLVDRGW